jgi:hypothetical protein
MGNTKGKMRKYLPTLSHLEQVPVWTEQHKTRNKIFIKLALIHKSRMNTSDKTPYLTSRVNQASYLLP